MDLPELYRTNKDFKEYVDKYMQSNEKTLSESLSDAMVKNYAAYLLAK